MEAFHESLERHRSVYESLAGDPPESRTEEPRDQTVKELQAELAKFGVRIAVERFPETPATEEPR